MGVFVAVTGDSALWGECRDEDPEGEECVAIGCAVSVWVWVWVWNVGGEVYGAVVAVMLARWV